MFSPSIKTTIRGIIWNKKINKLIKVNANKSLLKKKGINDEINVMTTRTKLLSKIKFTKNFVLKFY